MKQEKHSFKEKLGFLAYFIGHCPIRMGPKCRSLHNGKHQSMHQSCKLSDTQTTPSVL